MAGRTGVENTLRLRKRVFSPPDVAGRPDRPPGQVSGKGQKTTILIAVPVSGRLGYLTTTDAWVHYSFLRIIMMQRKGPRRINSSEGHRVKDRSLVPGRPYPHGRNDNTDRCECHYSRKRIIEHGVTVMGRW